MSDSTLMDFTVSESSGPPAAIYRATFVQVVKTTHPEYGDGARFDFKVKGGEHDGRIASRTTKMTPSSKNTCGKIMAGILGRAIAPGEKVSLVPYVGREFTIVVGAAPSGTGTRVEQVLPVA
jgi:hypothetical protein